jgi:hypothetical protein
VVFIPVMTAFFSEPPAITIDHGLPWQIEAAETGSTRVFGLTLGASTLADARTRFGNDLSIAIVAAPGQRGSLEAYGERVQLGYVTGKMVLTADPGDDGIVQMRERAIKTEYMESTTRRSTLAPDDMQLALNTPISAITFIPSVNLDEGVILQRFGIPEQRIRMSAHIEHFLYPDKGLDIVLDSEGKEVLQYVAPADFSRLRDPLTVNAN